MAEDMTHVRSEPTTRISLAIEIDIGTEMTSELTPSPNQSEPDSGHGTANLHNVRKAIALSPEFQNFIGFDRFTSTIQRLLPCSWQPKEGQWTREDDLRLTQILQSKGMNVHPTVVHQAVFLEAMDNSFDSLQRDLGQLKWDGVPRIDQWLVDCLGAPNTEYVRFVGSKFLIAAVARAFEPGCKVDTVLVLRGPQGIGKSTAIEVLASPERFTDQIPDLHTKDACIQLQGKHLIEIAELGPLKRARPHDVKSFISRRNDVYRAPYATHTASHPRRVVFVGTTNEDEYHSDPTGARRFWDVECTRVDLEALKRDRDQLWAEAVYQFKAGTQWHLSKEQESVAAAVQASHFVLEAWAPYIDGFVAEKQKVLTQDVLATGLGLGAASIDQRARRRVNSYLKWCGWEEKKSGNHRFWHRPQSRDSMNPIPASILPLANASVTASLN
jgi:putative DNA primase/helicase